jgi:hypothetical protein
MARSRITPVVVSSNPPMIGDLVNSSLWDAHHIAPSSS